MKKYQSVIRTLPNGTPAGLYVGADVDLDTSYAFVTGIAVREISNGGLADYDINLRDNNGGTFHSADAQLPQADKGVPPNLKFLSLEDKTKDERGIPISAGQGLKAELNTYADTTSELKVKITFRLEK